jgi:hypothetical protein
MEVRGRGREYVRLTPYEVIGAYVTTGVCLKLYTYLEALKEIRHLRTEVRAATRREVWRQARRHGERGRARRIYSGIRVQRPQELRLQNCESKDLGNADCVKSACARSL